MSSIQKFISKVCTQTAVYWPPLTNDGQGGKTFDTPYEIKCRWEDTVEIMSDKYGKSMESRATVLVTQDLEEEGFLCLTSIASILSQIASDPNKVLTQPLTFEDTYEIRRISKIPEIFSTTEFVRTVYLSNIYL